MACIDEFQDTDVDQWEIFRTLFGESVTLVLVGDPKQAIYGFRGADVYAYLDARAEVRAGGGREAGLAQNFRSHPDLVQAVNRIFGRGTAAFAAEGIEHADVQARRDAHERSLEGDPGPAFRLLPVTTTRKQKSAHERAVIAATVAEIRRLLGAGLRLRTEQGERPLGAGDITVLTRTHHQSTRVHRALREARIASVLGRSGDVHQSEAMEELGLILEAILDPRDPRTVRRALVTRLWGATLSELAVLEGTGVALADVHALLEELRQLWHRHGVLVAADRLLYRRHVAVRLLAEAEGDRLITDLRHALELVHRAAVDGQLSPGGTLHWLWRERTRSHDRDETRQLRLDRDDDAVRILTAHGAKGLEYEIVLVPFAWDGSTPRAPLQWHERGEGDRRLVIDANKRATGSPESARAQRELLAEELRLLYVALTRAKRRCVVLLTPYHKDASHSAGRSALFYLLHRAAALAGEIHDDYVQRCIDDLAAGPSKWEPLVPSWIADHVCIGAQRSASEDTIAPVAAQTVLEVRTRALPRDLGTRLQPWSLVSFSSLTRSVHAARGEAAVEADPSEAPIAERADPASSSPLLRPSAPEGIFAFARGARAGVCLHEIFETGDFSQALQDRDRVRIARILERHGLDDPRAHDGSLDPCMVAEELLLRAAQETFPFGGFPLSAVDRAHRLDEWEFRAALGRVRIGELADLFAAHAGEPWSLAAASAFAPSRRPRGGGIAGGLRRSRVRTRRAMVRGGLEEQSSRRPTRRLRFGSDRDGDARTRLRVAADALHAGRTPLPGSTLAWISLRRALRWGGLCILPRLVRPDRPRLVRVETPARADRGHRCGLRPGREPMTDALPAWIEREDLDPVAAAFARLLFRRARTQAGADAADALARIGALLCLERARGHACVMPQDWCAEELPLESPGEAEGRPPRLPDAVGWERALRIPVLVGNGDGVSVLVRREDASVALFRDDAAERRLARAFVEMLTDPGGVLALDEPARASFHALFPEAIASGQALAAAAAMRSRLCVITGGPGTGRPPPWYACSRGC
jgi:hypothetical protein